ncbi:MAG: M50 family metallopeptidase [Candidatus Eremiobacteraeota bacterium]|nr:M50 family metallopeptidase [Candidatus Eremiobacteraeota bacterium]
MKISESLRNILALGGCVLAAYLLWDTPLLYPLKLFVVILHEMSHGLAALICGGRIVEIKIDPRIGGLCEYLAPPSFFCRVFIASAGYLGSMALGSLILILAARTRFDRHVSLVIGIVVIVLTALYVREPFGIVFCLLFGIFMLVAARFLPGSFNDWLLKFLGMTSCLYAVVDIKEDLIDRSGIGSDADAIANMLGFPGLSVAIGIAWILLALAILVLSFRIAGSGGAQEAAGEDEEEKPAVRVRKIKKQQD